MTWAWVAKRYIFHGPDWVPCLENWKILKFVALLTLFFYLNQQVKSVYVWGCLLAVFEVENLVNHADNMQTGWAQLWVPGKVNLCVCRMGRGRVGSLAHEIVLNVSSGIWEETSDNGHLLLKRQGHRKNSKSSMTFRWCSGENHFFNRFWWLLLPHLSSFGAPTATRKAGGLCYSVHCLNQSRLLISLSAQLLHIADVPWWSASAMVNTALLSRLLTSINGPIYP